jgi:MinD superfamily P-loop ATPase
MNPNVEKRTDFMGGNIAIIDADKCSVCGQCEERCRFDAIHLDGEGEKYTIDEIDCEGCGVCVDLCPEQAIDFPIKKCGEWFISHTRFGAMVHARLGIAEENSGKLVTLVRQEARKLAEAKGRELIITDGPPGVGCPVIASVGGATALLIVTEPTVSGIHDMQRVVELAGHFKVPCMVCINKYDLNADQTEAIEVFAREKGVPVVGRVPFDKQFTESMVIGETIVEFCKNDGLGSTVKQIWERIGNHL